MVTGQYAVPEIWSTPDRIFCSFILLIAWKISLKNEKEKKPGDITILHKCTKNHDHDHTVLEIWHVTGVIVIFHFGLYFSILPPPPKQPKKWKNQKMKKKHGNIIILHKCTKNHDHMLCCSWDMVCDRCNYFSFWVIFCPFTSLTAPKMKISKKMKKKPGDIISLHSCTKTHDHMLYFPDNGAW